MNQLELFADDITERDKNVDPEQYGINECPFNPADVEVESMVLSVYNVLARIKNDELDLWTPFERSPNLWNPRRQSQLIESLILNIPLPAFYFTIEPAVDEFRMRRTKWHVVDGLQRLCAIRNFVHGDAKGRKLKLVDLEYLKRIEGKTFEELPASFRRNIEESQITAFLIRQNTPDDVKFNIFKRVNTGGMPLNQQEIRHALHQEQGAGFLKRLAELPAFKKATSRRLKPRRMVDREVINRFLAFYLQPFEESRYTTMDAFLNDALKLVDKMSDADRDGLAHLFEDVMNCVFDALGLLAFRRYDVNREKSKKAINKAIFESLTVVLARCTQSERVAIAAHGDVARAAYMRLFEDQTEMGLAAVVGTSTGHRMNIKRRYEIMTNYVQSVLREVQHAQQD